MSFFSEKCKNNLHVVASVVQPAIGDQGKVPSRISRDWKLATSNVPRGRNLSLNVKERTPPPFDLPFESFSPDARRRFAFRFHPILAPHPSQETPPICGTVMVLRLDLLLVLVIPPNLAFIWSENG